MSVTVTPARGASTAVGLLEATFVHLAGIGTRTERRLWDAGVSTWRELRATSWSQRPGLLGRLDASADALAARDLRFFHAALPSTERWRTYADFGQHFVSVDIETTGMSPVYDRVTLIGVEHHGRYETFIRGANLDKAADLLADAAGLITFNGARFDLPFLKRTFPGLELPDAHLDLRFLARRVGLAGPLKTVERVAELRRAEALDDLSGYAATVLWADFEHDADVEALAQLVLYNAADTLVLRPLAELVCDRLRERLHLREPTESAPVQPLFALNVARHAANPPGAPPELAPLPTVHHRGRTLHVDRRRVRLPSHRAVTPSFTLGALHARMRDPLARIVGIDLTGSQTKPSGWALLEGDLTITGVLGTDEQIIERTVDCRPRLVSIDSPLSLPIGRDCASDDCPCRSVGGIMRQSERELKRRGVNVYPCLIQSMQALTLRGMRLAGVLRAHGIEVIESYPGAAQDVMRIPRKRASQAHLRAGLARFGVRGLRAPHNVTHDELDAATSAVVGAFYLADHFEPLGVAQENFLIVPDFAPVADATPAGPGEPVRALVGTEAAALARRLRRPHVTTVTDACPARPLVVLDDIDAFIRALTDTGPRLRGMWVQPAGWRGRRKPSLFDEQRPVDAFDLTDAARAFLRARRRPDAV